MHGHRLLAGIDPRRLPDHARCPITPADHGNAVPSRRMSANGFGRMKPSDALNAGKISKPGHGSNQVPTTGPEPAPNSGR